MPSSTRRHATGAALAAASLAFLLTGCGSAGVGPGAATLVGSRDVLLQPVAAQGPDPFTQSTARAAAPLSSGTGSVPGGTANAAPSGTVRISGGTPGLYGGTRSVANCDVERQIRYLTGSDEGQVKARAFAEASRIEVAAVPRFLRGLTPVVLRVDARVTNHGFSGGSLTSYQSVLQAGTAVMVDANGMPRVRCACGNPLLPPTVFRGTATHTGQPWAGFRPTQVVVVTPAPVVINNLTIVNVVNNTWIERKSGSAGEGDRAPAPDKTLPAPPGPDDLHRDGSDPSPDADQGKTPGPDGQSTPGTTPGTTDGESTPASEGESTPAPDDSASGTPSDDGATPGSTAPGDPTGTGRSPGTPCPDPSAGATGPVPPGCPPPPSERPPQDPDPAPDTPPGPDGV